MKRPKLIRSVCLACVSFDVEAVVDEEGVGEGAADVQLLACFECRDVFYFMADSRPRQRRLGLFEMYGKPGAD